MDENIAIELEQKVENNQNNFLTFHIHKKLAILIFAGLLFLAFGVSAYYVRKQSVNKIQIPYPSPTSITNQTNTTPIINNQISPTISSTRNLDVDCVIDSDCPRAYASYGQRCIEGKCVMDDSQRESQQQCARDIDCGKLDCIQAPCPSYRCINNQCVLVQPSPTQKATYQTQSSCVSDSDCVIKDTPYCCGTKKEYYKWCYSAGQNPPDVSCANNGSCPGLVGSATSCICQNNVCTAQF